MHIFVSTFFSHVHYFVRTPIRSCQFSYYVKFVSAFFRLTFFRASSSSSMSIFSLIIFCPFIFSSGVFSSVYFFVSAYFRLSIFSSAHYFHYTFIRPCGFSYCYKSVRPLFAFFRPTFFFVCFFRPFIFSSSAIPYTYHLYIYPVFAELFSASLQRRMCRG